MTQDKAKAFGNYIKAIREGRGLSLHGLAARTGINAGTLSRLENGNRQPPKVSTLTILAKALEVPLADMFTMAGHELPYDLPSITPYLRARYGHLPDDALMSIEQYLTKITDEYGLDLDGPASFEDEVSEPQP